MFAYYIRIWDKYRKPVLSLAIITHNLSRKTLKNTYEVEAFGTILKYQYNVFHISSLDYGRCLHSHNCVEAALGILARTPKVPLWQKKADVVNKFVELGLNPDQIHLLISFVDRLSPLKPKELAQFEKYTSEKKKEVKMILTSFEEKGIEIGIEEGIQKGKFDSLLKILDKRFGGIPESMILKLQAIHQIEKLDKLIELAIQVDSLEKFLTNIMDEQLN